jgi:hypothetical protein
MARSRQVSKPKTAGSLQINQDLKFQRRDWIAERVGWAVMALLIGAALLGLFGPGPLSSTDALSADHLLRIEYNRFGRVSGPTELRVHLAPEATRGGAARLWLDRAYLEGVQIERVTPQPVRVEAGPDRHVFEFAAAKAGQPTAVTFHLKFQRAGSLAGRVGLADQPALEFSQFVYQ